MSTLKVIVVLIFLTAAISCNITKPANSVKLHPAERQDSLLTNSEGNKDAIKLLRDNKLWMTANLKLNIRDSYCYENTAQYCEQYGRLYTWESAKLGCSLLGEGWRLPATDEWQQLSVVYSGIVEDSTIIRKAAFKALLSTGSSGFDAVLGGGRGLENQYARVEAHGFYWTATATDRTTAWFANFAKGSQALYLQNDGGKARAFSVRCMKTNSR